MKTVCHGSQCIHSPFYTCGFKKHPQRKALYKIFLQVGVYKHLFSHQEDQNVRLYRAKFSSCLPPTIFLHHA